MALNETVGQIRLGTMIAKLEADLSSFEKDLDKAEKEVERFEFVSLKGLALAFGAVQAAAVTAFGFMSTVVLKVGGDVQAVGRRFDDVFGAGSSRMQAFVDDFANMAGLSKRAAKDGLAATMNLARGWGFTAEAGEELSLRAIRIAADLAAFNNLDTAETFVKIRAAMNGMTDGMGPLNVVLSEGSIMMRAMENTGKKAKSEITKLEEVIATLDEIADQAGPAMGALARGQGDAAIEARKLKAIMKDATDDLADRLLPVVQELLPVFQDWVAALADVALGFANVGIAISDFLGVTNEAAREFGQMLSTMSKEQLESARQQVRGQITALIAEMDAHKGKLSTKVMNFFNAFFDSPGGPVFGDRKLAQMESDLAALDQMLDRLEARLGNLPSAARGRSQGATGGGGRPDHVPARLGATIKSLEEAFHFPGQRDLGLAVAEDATIALEKWIARMEEGGEVTASVRNKFEAANLELLRLQSLFDQGVISAQTFNRAVRAVEEGLEDAKNQTIDWGKEIQQQLFQIGFQAGRDLIVGLIDGTASLGDTLKRTLSRLLESAIFLGFKFLMFGSPSKLMMQFGRDTIAGYVIGLQQMQGELASATSVLASVPAAAGAGASMMAGARITPDFSSIPGPVTPREVARDQAWQEIFQETARELETSGFQFGGE